MTEYKLVLTAKMPSFRNIRYDRIHRIDIVFVTSLLPLNYYQEFIHTPLDTRLLWRFFGSKQKTCNL